MLIGLPIAFGATHGSISGAQATIQATGTATATFTNDGTCLAGTASATVDTTPGPTVSTPVTVTCPDLTATKTNNVGGSVPLSAGSWTWTIHVANGGYRVREFRGHPDHPDRHPAQRSQHHVRAGRHLHPHRHHRRDKLRHRRERPHLHRQRGRDHRGGGLLRCELHRHREAAGTYANPSGGSCAVDPNNNVPETNEANNSCSNSVTVVGPPTISKAFSPTSIAVGGTSTLSLTITNPNGGTALAGVAVSDTLPAGVQVASTPNASNTCNGTLTGATAGSGAISLSSGSIAAGGRAPSRWT